MVQLSCRTQVRGVARGYDCDICFNLPTSALPAVTSPPPSASAAPKMVYARVKFSRKAGSSTEVDITAGETVGVLNQAGEWWYGTTLNGGKPGTFRVTTWRLEMI